MKSPSQTILAGLLLALAPGPLHAASTVRFTWSVVSTAENAGNAEVTVLRADDLDTAVTVNYASTALTATAGADYTETSGTLAFGPGERVKVLAIPILNDALRESTESLRLTLSSPGPGAILGSPGMATLHILDNDFGVSFAQPVYFIAEPAGDIQTTVVRGNDVDLRAFTVDYATVAGGAMPGADFVAQSGTLSFTAGQLSKELRIAIINDGLLETNETFGVTLSNATGGPALGSLSSAQITIRDNDGGVSFGSSAMTVAEDSAEAVLAVVRRDDVNLPAFTVDYATADISTTAGVDYMARSGTLSFAGGQLNHELRIPILNDGIRQPSKLFRVTLSNATGGLSMGTPKDINITIADNDNPGVGFEFVRYFVWENAGQVVVNVVRGNDGDPGPFTVEVHSADDTAVAGSDYQAVSSVLDFKENETVKQVAVPILTDSVVEGLHHFRLSLTNATGGRALGTASTTVSINDSAAPGAFQSFTPSEASSLLFIERDSHVNVLSWVGAGQLQRADELPGPWATLVSARSPFRSASLLPRSFYRVHGRPADVYVPAGYDPATPMPLVIVLHYRGPRGAAAVDEYLGLSPFADSRGFLYCLPNGTVDQTGRYFWNATDACCDFDGTGVDDALYLGQLIKTIGQVFAVDRKRVCILGYSTGGFMAHRVACEYSDLIAGMASLAGVMSLDSTRCQPSEPVNILHIHGTADTGIPYGGGKAGDGLPQTGEMPGALQTVQMWASHNHCADPVTEQGVSMDLDLDVPGLDTVVMRYTNCPPGGAVELWTMNGGSHAPGIRDTGTESEFTSRVIDWLLAHPKP